MGIVARFPVWLLTLPAVCDSEGAEKNQGPHQTADTSFGCGSNPMVPFWIGARPILVYFSGDWDVHWGYDLDFDPWPFFWKGFTLNPEGAASLVATH